MKGLSEMLFIDMLPKLEKEMLDNYDEVEYEAKKGWNNYLPLTTNLLWDAILIKMRLIETWFREHKGYKDAYIIPVFSEYSVGYDYYVPSIESYGTVDIFMCRSMGKGLYCDIIRNKVDEICELDLVLFYDTKLQEYSVFDDPSILAKLLVAKSNKHPMYDYIIRGYETDIEQAEV